MNKGGRPTKRVSRLRETLTSVVANELTAEKVSKLIKEIHKEEGAKAAMNAYVMLLEYVLPRLQRVEHTGKGGDELTVGHVLRQISAQGASSDLPPIDGKAEPSGLIGNAKDAVVLSEKDKAKEPHGIE